MAEAAEEEEQEGPHRAAQSECWSICRINAVEICSLTASGRGGGVTLRRPWPEAEEEARMGSTRE